MTVDAPILVLNAGSATLKYRLVGGGPGHAAQDGAGGQIEHIGEPGGPGDHRVAVERAFAAISAELPAGPPVAVGHRVVHGGAELRDPVRIDASVEAAIDRAGVLAPIHNPPALAVIRAARAAFGSVPHVAVFDTGFHATLPAAASTYALDREVARTYGIRRYGFHGISVRYVRDRTAVLLGRPSTELNMIVLHLGNGASATALSGGISVATSMGMTPLEGLVMGTRSGDLDPAVTFHLARAGWPLDDIENLYEHRAGLVGLCGDNDLRIVEARAAAGDGDAELAFEVYCRRIRMYVGAYHAILGRLDAIVFTGGVGEHSVGVRSRALAGLAALGIEIDEAANGASPGARVVSTGSSRVVVCVVPTDEERAIAQDVAALLHLPGW